MILKGFKVRRNRNLTFRHGDPVKDTDLRGRPVPTNYVVIVKVTECRHYEKNGQHYIDPSVAPMAVKLAYGGTYYGYSERVTKTSKYPVRVQDFETGEETVAFKYTENRVYFVKDGAVYTAVKRMTIPVEATV